MNLLLTRAPLAALLVASLSAACGDDAPEETVASEFCEHAEIGPFQTIAATATSTDAPAASYDHTSMTITFTDYEGQMGGCVYLDIEEATEFVLAVGDADVTMVVHDAAGAEVPAEMTESITACTELARMDTFDFEVGRYDVCFGPTALTEVKFGIEESGAGHDHEE